VKFIAIIWLLALSALAQKAASSSGALNSFTSPDGSFRITYPQILVRCELRPNGDGYDWAQSDCLSYHPVCGDQPVPGQPIICIAYPQNEHTGNGTFEAAAFSVGESNGSEKVCLTGERRIKDVIIGGIKFKGFLSGDGGMSQSRTIRSYMAFHKGKCYDLAIWVATADAGAFDPPARELSKADWAEIDGRLNEVRDSFRFLK
jgi:hypothetical protein